MIDCAKIAKDIEYVAAMNTLSGSYFMSFDELEFIYKIPHDEFKRNAIEIMRHFSDDVAECEIDDDGFDLVLFGDACCKECVCYQEGNRCYDSCHQCEIWCDDMEGDD